jgi:hypothetical protein
MKIRVQTEDELFGQRVAPRHTKRLLIMFAFIVVIASIFIYTINKPGQGIITPAKVQSEAKVATTKTLTSPYYTVEYPGDYEIRTNIPKGADQKDLQVIQKPSLRFNTGSIRISYGVEPLPSGDITTMSPYNLARAFPSRYNIDTTPCATETCQLLTKHDDTSTKIILWPHDKNVLVVALSAQTAGSPADYDTLVAQIIKTLKWK